MRVSGYLRMPRRVFLTAILVSVVCLVHSTHAHAALTFTVNSRADAVDASPGDGTCETATPGECTLRAAVQEANATPGADNINLPSGVFKLTIAGGGEDLGATGDLDVHDGVAIAGIDADST